MGDSPPEAAAEVFEMPKKSMLPHAKELVFNPQAGQVGCCMHDIWFFESLVCNKGVQTWFSLYKYLCLKCRSELKVLSKACSFTN